MFVNWYPRRDRAIKHVLLSKSEGNSRPDATFGLGLDPGAFAVEEEVHSNTWGSRLDCNFRLIVPGNPAPFYQFKKRYLDCRTDQI